MTGSAFTDFLSRRAEHLDDEIIRSMHPTDTWVGHVSTGRFKAEDGVEHTFDRFENVFPDLSGQWEDVTAASCVGTPCDPQQSTIGLGFTRDSYKLQRRSYGTDLFCFDQILSADRAKQQFAHVVRTLRRASGLITSHRFRTEGMRIAKYKWATANNTLTPITMYWNTGTSTDGTSQTILNVSVKPTSKLTPKHLQRRVTTQMNLGALGEDIYKGREGKQMVQPKLEFVSDMESLWDMNEGNPELTDHWRYSDFEQASKEFYSYGWNGTIGNYGVRSDSMPLRFMDLETQNSDGTWQLQLVFPYTNVAATEGIKEDINPDYEVAPIQLDFIWHRLAMTSLVRDSTAINPEMPFAMRDFAGKWKFAMDNLVLGGNPVDNRWGNKGIFISMFSFATKAEYPEFAEVFLHLREPATIIDNPRCAADPGYPTTVGYSSANAACPTNPVVLTFTPVLFAGTGTYEVPGNSILCNGLTIFHGPITGTSTLATLVAQMNTLLSAMGTWAVSGSNITLTGTSCTNVNIDWSVGNGTPPPTEN